MDIGSLRPIKILIEQRGISFALEITDQFGGDKEFIAVFSGEADVGEKV